jgi:hypothetical protein
MVIGAFAGPRIGQLSIGIVYLCSVVCPKEEANKTNRTASNNFLHIVVTSCKGKKRGT